MLGKARPAHAYVTDFFLEFLYQHNALDRDYFPLNFNFARRGSQVRSDRDCDLCARFSAQRIDHRFKLHIQGTFALHSDDQVARS